MWRKQHPNLGVVDALLDQVAENSGACRLRLCEVKMEGAEL
jgi:hypothetical protein